jgi:drug/metabolite transporter (DMT)-like permease
MTTSASSSAIREQNIPLGIGLMLLAVLLFALNDTLGKWLAARFSSPQILMFRSFAALLVLTPMLWRIGFRSLIDVERPWLQALRAVLASVEVALFYWSVAYLPLADAMTYYLAGPIYVTILAAVFLHEKVGWRRWTAVLVGFAGVVIALGPSIGSFGWPVFIPFAGSIVNAVFLVTTRVLRGTRDAVMATWQVASALGLGIIGAPLAWTPVTWIDGLLLCGLGVVALGATMSVNRALALAPASAVVPYQYTMIVWAVLFGYLVFGDIPGRPTFIGAAIIVGAGLFIFFREQQRGVAAAPDMPPER